jgi:hypothetical protein
MTAFFKKPGFNFWSSGADNEVARYTPFPGHGPAHIRKSSQYESVRPHKT